MTVPPAPGERLPDGFAVRLDPRTRRRDGGTALLGGSPLRLLRLAPAARGLLDGDRLVVTDRRTAVVAGRLLDTGLAHPELPPGDPAQVTVVVPVKDRSDALARLLAALRADPDTAGCPVVVVDDGSADPAAIAAAADSPGVRLLRHERNRGPSAARNTGLRVVDTPAVAFVDSDCEPRPGWLPRLAAHLADPRIALVAPRITGQPVERPNWVVRYEAVGSAHDMGARPAPVVPWSAVAYVPSAALLARRAALGDGFDESMEVAEDVDLVWRLVEAGWRVRYEPAAQVAHDHRARPAEWLRRRAFYGTGAALLARKHPGAVAPVVVSPGAASVWLLAVLGGRWGRVAAAAVLAGSTARMARKLRVPGRPLPVGLAAAVVARGTGASARTLGRAVTRHHWPLALAAALVSRRARWVVAGTAAADALIGWWPRREVVTLADFTVGRRLEDVAYGAGLWTGVLRARDPRALLPARPRT
ncbi:mycofactocin biosynthesis glycosyltransferase MftF [Modestobacter sp. NPDC049651]|uniref:mycofactocin biosynthesis glycosyltransferase MftF n=1 Tax=unclassified Modestobacter TaxID=2643866 RepID=UPI003408DB54